MLSVHICYPGALIVYAVILNEKLAASKPRGKQTKRDKKMKQQEIIKNNGSLGSQEKVNYDKYLPF